MPAIEVEELAVSYGDVAAVSDLSFRVYQGEIAVVLGVNGAGKTSTMDVLAGYREPNGGTACVLGRPAGSADIRHRVGVALQAGGLHLGARPSELVDHHRALLGVDREEGRALLAGVLGEDTGRRTIRQLSGGQQRRVALTLALLGRPDVLLLDEPTAGVDVHGRESLRQHIANARNRGAAVLLSTHELVEAELVADRVLIMDRGSLVAEGTIEALREQAGEAHTVLATAEPIDSAALAAAVGVPVQAIDGPATQSRYSIAAAGTTALLAAVTTWLGDRHAEIVELRAGGRDLEAVFRALTAEPVEAQDRAGPRRARRSRS